MNRSWKVNLNVDVIDLNVSVYSAILEAANQRIKKKGGKMKTKIVPCCTKKCEEAIKSQNKAFKMYTECYWI